MKIVCITPVFPPIRAGMARAAFEIARSLESHASVAVASSASFLRYGHASFHPFIGRSLRDADIVLLHYPFFGAMEPLALAMLLPHRAKLVMWYHMDAVGSGWLRPLFALHRALIAPWVLRRADAFVFASRDYVVSGSHADIILKKPHREIPFGVTRSVIPSEPLGRVEGSQAHEISRFADSLEMTKKDRAMTEPVVFGFVGGLDRQHAFKGVDVLLEAFKNIGGAARLVIVGDGDRRKAYEAKAPPGVRFVGSVSDEQLADIYRLMDVIVLPSTDRSEAFGMVVAEAMACGTPAIVSDLPGVRGVIGPGDACGVRVPPVDAASLASAMQDVIQNRDAWRTRGLAAAAYVAEHYRWDRVASELADFFERLLQR